MTDHHQDHTGGRCQGHDDHIHIDDPPPRQQPAWGRLMSRLGGHSHIHGHTTADHLEASREGLRALWVSLAGLGVTALAQAAVVAVSGSVALLADTIHNATDALTAVPLGVAFVLARRRPTRRYTYGYGRAEDLAGVFVVTVIALSAGIAAWQAIEWMIDPRDIQQAGLVAVAGLMGFAGNEAVAGYRIRAGQRIGSAALVADGLHARTDGLTSLAVLGAALGSLVGWRLADPVIGLAISIAILRVLCVATRDVFRRLMDGVEPDLVGTVADQLASVPGIQAVERVRVRWIGHQLHADADVALDADLALARAHDILEDARHSLLHHVPRLADALLHAGPASDGRLDPHARTHHHFAAG